MEVTPTGAHGGYLLVRARDGFCMIPRRQRAYPDFMRGRAFLVAMIAGVMLAGCGTTESAAPMTSTIQSSQKSAVVAMHWTPVVRLVLKKTPPEYSPPIPLGTPVSEAQLKEFNGVTSRSCSGATCWALGTPNGDEAPLVSYDGGRSWRSAGTYFTVPAADGAAFAQTIEMLPKGIVAAYGANPLYLTRDGGRTWYMAMQLGNIASVWARPPARAGGEPVLILKSESFYSASSFRFYNSSDGGVTWTLQSGQALPFCSPSHGLHATMRTGGAGGMQISFTIVYVNSGPSACKLAGTPGLQPLFGPDHAEVGPSAHITSAAGHLGAVVLQPRGGAASSVYSINSVYLWPSARCAPSPSDAVAVHLQGVPVFELRIPHAFADSPMTDVCTALRSTIGRGVVPGQRGWAAT